MADPSDRLKQLLSTTPQERLAVSAGTDAPAIDNGQSYLTNPLGMELHADRDTGKAQFAAPNGAQATQGGEGAMGQARLGGVTGGRVNLADAERARAEFLAAKAATVHPSDRAGMMNTASSDGSPRAHQALRPLSNDELMAKANEMLDMQRGQTQGNLSQGPSTGARNDAGGQTPAWLTSYMDQEPDETL